MQIRENISLRPFNTFKIDVTGRYFSVIRNTTEIIPLLDFLKIHHLQNLFILGGGSNVLFTGNYNGLIIKNEIEGIEIVKEEDEYIYVKAGAGENWHQFVQYCLRNNFAGVENLALIPGSVGATPMQNIGAYGVEIKEVFYELEALHLKDKQIYSFSLNDCQFGYRESIFKKQYKNQYIIISVTYRLYREPHFNISYGAIQQELDNLKIKDLSIQAIAQAVMNIRSSKLPDPSNIGNAGSFFKNPQITAATFKQIKLSYPDIPSFRVDDDHVKIPAGWLIEQCGWKGFRRGDAGCYPKQALVLVNYGCATGKEIYDLGMEILQSVKNKFGLELETEVNIV